MFIMRETEREREREGLGLPIHMASAANVAAAETLGDELLKGCEHTTRHNRVSCAR